MGKPKITTLVDLNYRQDELVETITHEFTLHLSGYSKILDAYNKSKKIEDAYKVWNSPDDEHHDLIKGAHMDSSKNYNKTKKEIIEKHPNLKNVSIIG